MPAAIDVAVIHADQLADAQSRSVEQFEDGAVAAGDQLSLEARERSGFLLCFAAGRGVLRRGSAAGQAVQKIIDFLGGLHARDALGKFGRAYQARGVLQGVLLADAKFEKGAQGGEFAGDGGFLEFAVVKPGDELADDDVVYLAEGQSGLAGRSEEGLKKPEVAAIVLDRFRRSVALVAQVADKFVNDGFHGAVGGLGACARHGMTPRL